VTGGSAVQIHSVPAGSLRIASLFECPPVIVALVRAFARARAPERADNSGAVAEFPDFSPLSSEPDPLTRFSEIPRYLACRSKSSRDQANLRKSISAFGINQHSTSLGSGRPFSIANRVGFHLQRRSLGNCFRIVRHAEAISPPHVKLTRLAYTQRGAAASQCSRALTTIACELATA
jgi:hypothetical protein